MVEKAKQSSIQAIDRKSVHQICSGQVVLNLSTAVKELVENSVDAGATAIEIKLKEFGAELIEVSDNGTGIESKNFKSLALKHHTSKIKDFDDLVSVETYGFRGEALSSLCALSDMSVVTRHASATGGTRLAFDSDGFVTSDSACARQVGTTVTIQRLFHSLPVRSKQFHATLHREYTKMMQVLQAYGIILTGTRLTCSNTPAMNGRKSTVLSTVGSMLPIDNYCNIFGAKQVKSMLDFVKTKPSKEDFEEFNVKAPTEELLKTFQIKGFISSCKHGTARSSPDRQYIYINKRPCDFPKLCRVINDIYHQFNRHQYPCFVLDICSVKESVDVNVTPDKRCVLLHQENVILVVVKASLKQLYNSESCNYDIVHLDTSNQQNCPSDSLHPDQVSDVVSCPSKGEELESSSSTVCFKSLDRFRSKHGVATRSTPSPAKQQKLHNMVGFTPFNKTRKVERHPLNVAKVDKKPGAAFESYRSSGEVAKQKRTSVEVIKTEQHGSQMDDPSVIEETNAVEMFEVSDGFNQSFSPSSPMPCDNGEDQGNHDQLQVMLPSERGVDVEKTEQPHEPVCKALRCDPPSAVCRLSVDVEVDMSKLKESLLATDVQAKQALQREHLFVARISPDQNSTAERELERHVTKSMFKKMKIIGQFNKGFIITQHENELFIIDQHATDEKYNFEFLQNNEKLTGQKLFQPRQLELTTVNEDVLINNIGIFKQNGFEFEIDESAQPGTRIKLVSLPVSKNWIFGVDDVDELVFQLSDAPGVHCRPSRVRQMFASRACRKSVMIGTSLTVAQMKTLVNHMGDLEHPWNCPHGRPTMRHLFSLHRL